MARGMQAAAKAASDAQSAGSGRSGGRLSYFSWKDGETKIIRFLTDDVITADFYEFVVAPNATPPEGIELKPSTFIVPASVYADIDGNIPPEYANLTDWVKKLGGKTKEYGSGKLLDLEPKKRTVALAVELEEAPVEVDGKMRMKYRDVLDTIEVKDTEYPCRVFGIVKQAYKNFWVQLVGYHQEWGTLCDRPYKITRRGKQDVSYQIIPLSADPDFDIKTLQEDYGYGHPRESDDEDRFLYCPQTLDEWAEYYGSEERVRRFMLGEENPKSSGSSSSNGSSDGTGEFKKETTHNPEPEADEAQAAPPPPRRDNDLLRERLERHRNK